ncbi:hypothetical protein Fcan01_00249 [Folsomia candida]|uniref:Uncharacterized protein n=1 Tax=Folsomia candida TaxID=158441 RepID=A0A226EZM7_FOLCA|nr:hypothetical protein Fcan01_00249 [Folsomia candida]
MADFDQDKFEGINNLGIYFRVGSTHIVVLITPTLSAFEGKYYVDRYFPEASVLHVSDESSFGFSDDDLFQFLLRDDKFPKVLRLIRDYYRYFYGTEEETENLIETRATLSYCGVNPAYIFVILDVVNTKMVAIPHEMALTSKFFVIHRHPSVKRDARAALKLCAVCFPCSAPYQVLDCKSGGDFSSLDELWNDHNSNLRGWKIGSDIFSVSFDPKREACNAIKSGNKIFAGYITCAQLALQGIHNFSNIIISEKRVLSSLLNPTFYVSYGRFIPCNLIDVLLLTPAVRPRIWLPYCERKFQITGTTVSYQKARFGGLRGLIFAFDAYTWEASGVSFFLISILLAVIGGWRDGDTKLNVFFPIFANRGNGCCFPIHVFVRGCCGGAKSSDRFGGRGGFKNSNNYDDDGCDEDKTAVEHVMIDDVLSGAGNRQDCTAH